MKTANDFWGWFNANQAQFLFVHDVERKEAERMLKSLHDELHSYDSGLFCQIGGKHSGAQEIIITAEGNTAKFEAVETLVAAAPEFKEWRVIAFKPAMGVEFSIEVSGHAITPAELFFKPLKSNASPELLGVRIGLPVYDEAQRTAQLQLTYLILESLLGEQSFAKDIDYVDIVALCESPKTEGFIALNRLEDFIAWNKENGAKQA